MEHKSMAPRLGWERELLRFHGQIEPMLYYAGHNCVLAKPRDRRLPAVVWVPLRDVSLPPPGFFHDGTGVDDRVSGPR